MMYPTQTNMASTEKQNPVVMALLRAQQQQGGPIVQKLGGPQSTDPARAPSNIGEGLSALGDGLVQRQQSLNAMYPSAPGGEQPSFMTAMKNLFSGGNNGGLW